MPAASRWRPNCSSSTSTAMPTKSATVRCRRDLRTRRGWRKPIVRKLRSKSPRTEPRANQSRGNCPMSNHAPVTDWVHDFDHTDPRWTENPFPIWDELRGECPVVHTKRFLGCYLPTTYEAVKQIAYDTEHFSSRRVIVRDVRPETVPAPPITSDPPEHKPAKQ